MHCPICGRFLRRVLDAVTGLLRGWVCAKAWDAGEGQWEHD